LELNAKIIESTKEIFSMMVAMEVSVDEDWSPDTVALLDSISGVVGLAGMHKGVLAIHFPNSAALAVTTSLLGMDINEINEDVEDAIGELANMLAGDIKTMLSGNGRDIALSLPTTISGQEYDFQPTKEVEKIMIPFNSSAGKFSVEFQLEK